MARIRAGSGLRPALIGGVALAALLAWGGAPTLRSVTVEGGGVRVEIGAVRLGGMLGAALAQAPGEVTLTDLVITTAPATYRLPRAVFAGVSLSRDELARLMDPNGAEPAAARLARLNARQVTIPELVIEQQVAGGRAVTTYRDVVLRDVAGGRIGSLATPGGTVTADGANAPSGTYGAVTGTDLDLPGILALYTERAGAAPAPLRRLYGALTLQDMTLRDPKGFEVRLARAEARDVQGRPTPESWNGTLARLAEIKPEAKPTPEQTQRMMGALADVLDAFEIGGAEMTGLVVRDTGKANTEVKVARLAYAGGTAERRSDARVEGVEVTAPDARVAIGRLQVMGFSYGSSLRAAAEMGGRKPEEMSGAELRRLIPQLGTIRVEDVRLEGPDPSAPAGAGAPMRYALRALELTADRQVNAIPTNIRYSLQGLSLSLPPDTSDAGLKTLIDLGYRDLDISMLVAATWEEAAGEVALQEVSLRGAEMGTVTLRGTLGGVGRDAFNPDSAVATVALLGATAKSLNVVVENTGLFDKVLASESRRQGKPAEAIRREYAGAAAVGIPAVLGNSAAARSIGQAVARFVAAPKRLTVSLRAKEPAGFGFADFAALNQPTEVLDRLDVSAIAE